MLLPVWKAMGMSMPTAANIYPAANWFARGGR